MENTKKVVSVLLCLVLVFSAFTVSASAQETVNWDEFYFTKQPQDVVITNGESFTLSVEVNAPEGVELSYHWNPSFYGDAKQETDTLTVNKGESRYPSLKSAYGFEREYYCTVTATQKGEDGRVINRKTIESDRATVSIKMNAVEGIKHIVVTPWSDAFDLTLALTGLTFGMFLPLAPIIYVGSLAFCFGVSIKEVIESSGL